jgi:hypothetical protein
MAAERGKKLDFPPEGLETFVPEVAQGTWSPNEIVKAASK